MRYRVIALFSAVLSVVAAFCTAAMAEEAKSDVKGIFLLTDYPAVTLRPGSTSSITLKLQNHGLPPPRLTLSVNGVPSGWTANLIGGRGPAAQAPQNFDATYTEQYGSQELNALPLDPGQSKDVKLKVRPPNTVAAGKYKVTAKVSADDATAASELVLDITGQPKIDIAGREGVLSAKASAGQETSIPVILTNSGTAPAEQIELSGSVPTGWKVNFEPKTVDRIAPSENKEVQAMVTPAAKAVAGDYVTTVRAAARGESASQSFRVAVTTSTIWGIVGIALIGGAPRGLIGAPAWVRPRGTPPPYGRKNLTNRPP